MATEGLRYRFSDAQALGMVGAALALVAAGFAGAAVMSEVADRERAAETATQLFDGSGYDITNVSVSYRPSGNMPEIPYVVELTLTKQGREYKATARCKANGKTCHPTSVVAPVAPKK